MKKMSIINSYATYRNLQSRLKERVFYSTRGGVDVGLLSENHHNINFIMSEDPLSWITSYAASLSGLVLD